MEGSFSMKKFYLAFLLTALCMPTFVTAQETVAQVARPVQDITTPKPYLFGPGDKIAGRVMSDQEYNFEVEVDAKGLIYLPFAGNPVVAQCKSEDQLRDEITKLLQRDLKNPQWTLSIPKRSKPPVTIFGEVNTKTTVDLTRAATLFEMVGLAGGATKEAGQVVNVYRRQKVACSDGDDPNNWKGDTGDLNETPFKVFNLADMEKGLASQNPEIMPGDVIHIPQAAPVYVVGEVFSPQAVLLKKIGGTTVMDALSFVGGPRPEAKLKDVKVYRKKTGYDERQEISVNLEKIRKREQKDIFLEPYDLIVVDKAKKSIALTIAEFALGAGRSIITSAANQTGVRVVY
jgi:protein involved in polysaccharide export with SLBB domain